jgi:hypothetical protein
MIRVDPWKRCTSSCVSALLAATSGRRPVLCTASIRAFARSLCRGRGRSTPVTNRLVQRLTEPIQRAVQPRLIRSRLHCLIPAVTNSMSKSCFDRRVSNIMARKSSSNATGSRKLVKRFGTSSGGTARSGGSSSSIVGVGRGAGAGVGGGMLAASSRGAGTAIAGLSPLASPFRIRPVPSDRSSGCRAILGLFVQPGFEV